MTEQHAKVAKNRHELGICRRNEPSMYEPLSTLSTLKKEVPLNPVKKMLEHQTAKLELKQYIKSIVHGILESAICDIDDSSNSPTPSTVFVDNTVET